MGSSAHPMQFLSVASTINWDAASSMKSAAEDSLGRQTENFGLSFV